MSSSLTTMLLIATLAIGLTTRAGGVTQPNAATSSDRCADSRTQKQQKRERTESNSVDIETRRTQAISVLHAIVDGAGQIASLESQATLVSNALDVLWKHEAPYARANFLRTLDRFFVEYSSRTNTAEQKDQAANGIKTLISHLSKHDPAGGAAALDRYWKLTDQSSEGLPLRDRLAIAQAGLDVDRKQSVTLAARVLDAGVPVAFTDYLYQLEVQDRESATGLYDLALRRLSSNPNYTPNYATILSAYAFREKLLVLEVRSNRNGVIPIEFGSLAINLSPPPGGFSLQLAGAYLNTAYAFLETKAALLGQETQSNPEYVMQCYFLARKLNGYATKLNLSQSRLWDQLGNTYELLALRAGFTVGDLSNLSNLANKLVAEGSIFQFDDGASAFEKAKTAKDIREKTEFLVRGIHELVEAEKFEEAERKISEIEDKDITERVTDYLHFRAGKTAIRKRDWNDVSYRSSKLNDSRLRMYLCLEGMKAAFANRKKDIASSYLQSAANTVQRIEDKSIRAKGFVAIAGLLALFDPASSSQPILDAIKAINQADGYDALSYSVTIELPKIKLIFSIDDSDLNSCFRNSAKSDWTLAINSVRNIDRGEIRSMAQLAVCRTVL